MSEENIEVVGRVTEIAANSIPPRGDPGTGFDECVAQGLIAPNLEWRGGTRGGVGVAGLDDVVGREGFVQFARSWINQFDDYETEYERIIDAGGDRVLVLIHMSGTGKESRAPVELRTAQLYELEAGCVIRVLLFLDREAAFKAAGLSECALDEKAALCMESNTRPGKGGDLSVARANDRGARSDEAGTRLGALLALADGLGAARTAAA